MSRRVLRLAGPVVRVCGLKRAGAGCFVGGRTTSTHDRMLLLLRRHGMMGEIV